MDKDDQKEGLFNRLKNIEDKSEEQLDEIKYQGERQKNMVNEKTKEPRKIELLKDQLD